jgi:hypothetical protein
MYLALPFESNRLRSGFFRVIVALRTSTVYGHFEARGNRCSGGLELPTCRSLVHFATRGTYMRIIRPAFLLLILTLAAPLSAFIGTDDIVGTWFNQDKDAKIEISECGGNYCGKIVWLKDPAYSPDRSWARRVRLSSMTRIRMQPAERTH